MTYILLEKWARKQGVKSMDAKNWARRGKLKTAKKKNFPVERWIIEEDEPLKTNSN